MDWSGLLATAILIGATVVIGIIANKIDWGVRYDSKRISRKITWTSWL